ncbi:hypothetical protein NW762_010948 [Fusarium torreyae]|uniref:Pisatin demethylase cytochrome P450 n=1 Tax=Fusarium torreyae TaxID=1237075 RepID=A0A9W8V9Q3_9HYPO|nr:hypothetical protein NW762_010948 [Fusarium torreyae]
MNTELFAALFAALLLLRVAVALIQHLRSHLRTVQGPWFGRLTSGWYAWKVWQGSFQQVNLDLHRRYGSIVRYAPNRYSISDLDAVKVIYSLGTSFPKSSWYTTWASPGQTNLFSERSVAKHAHDRKQYQATYSMSSLIHYEAFVDNCADLFKTRLSELCSSNRAVDMRHWFQCYAFDVIGMITYGKRLGFLDHGDDVGNVIGALEDHLGYATLTGIFPSLHKVLFPLKNLLAGGKGAGRAYVMAFTKDRISESQAQPKAMPLDNTDTTTEDFLTKFLAKHSADPSNFTSFLVLSGCVSNMVAGSDTTAISLSAVMYYLLKNPACMAKLREEVDSFTSKGQLSHHPTYKESQQMPYLQAAIKEALRLHPATGLPLERVVPKGGATISGRFFPEGAIVGINTWVAHRDRNIFGQDADEFSPERWLQNDADKVALMNRFWMPFGLGSRTCIGRHISMLEMCKLIPTLVRDFDLSLHESLRGKDWHTQNYWFVKPVDFQVYVQPRKVAL